MITVINKIIPKQPPEKEYGNKEYKRFLIKHPRNNENNFVEKRSTQMLYRLIEGNGKALYLFGIEDNGEVIGMTKKELDNTIIYLKKITKNISAKIKNLRVYNGGKGFVCSARISLPLQILNDILDSINLEPYKDV